ncbi:MAG: glycosyltransferase family 9 protein [Planctomycetes bacterium]|nr:glycosyltransferase family 9 protein [Planctomycetota bacterium]
MIRRLLVVRRGGLGDTLLLAPVLRALARRTPGVPIDFAGVREFTALLVGPGLADGARSSEDLAAYRFPHDAAVRKACSERHAAVVADDAAFARLADHDCFVQVFDPRPQPGVRAPLAQQIAAQLGLVLAWPHDAWLVRHPPPAVAGAVVVLAPGSGGRAKCWPRAHWLLLARGLAETAKLAVVVGPAEIERDDPRTWPWPVPVAFVVEAAPSVLAVRLHGAAAFVGNDSGPTHLAAMLGVPTVALFGPSDAVVYAPQGPCVEIVVAPSGELAALAPSDVVAAVARVQGR